MVSTLLAFSSSGLAEDDTKERQKFEDTIHVIQRKPVLEENRFELTPRFGMSVNDSIYRSFKVGTNANFHISERLYVGGLFEWFDFGEALGGETKAFEQSFDQTSTFPDAPVPNWFGGLEVGYKPIYGKFAFFNLSILYYDIGASLGGGWLNAGSIQTQASGTIAATGSLIGRLFVSDWMAINLELRDVFFRATLQGGDEKSFANLVTVAGGVSFYLPPSFEYSKGGEKSE